MSTSSAGLVVLLGAVQHPLPQGERGWDIQGSRGLPALALLDLFLGLGLAKDFEEKTPVVE